LHNFVQQPLFIFLIDANLLTLAHVGRPFGIMVYPSYMTGDAGKHAHISAYVMLT
jgi:hypothetical protein